MELSHFHKPLLISGLCVRRSRSLEFLQDIPSRPTSHRPQCSDSNLTFVLDCSSNVHWTWCSRCQQLGDEVPQSTTSCPNLWVCQVWFPRGLLSHMGRLYGWRDSPISLGGGPQSWLCPLISLALESIEIARCVSRLSTGPHHLVPDPQREFWCSTALEIIQMFCVHMQSLTHDSEVAQGLQDNCDGWPVPSDQNRKTSLFSVVAPTNHHVYREAIVASNPCRFASWSLSSTPALWLLWTFPKAGPAHFTKFLGMFLGNYYATVSEINRFNGSIRACWPCHGQVLRQPTLASRVLAILIWPIWANPILANQFSCFDIKLS